MAPRPYYCKNNETIVLEYFKTNNYKLIIRYQNFDLDHCKAALRAMATYHANSISYEEYKSNILQRTFKISESREKIFKEILFDPEYKTGPGYKFNVASKNCFLKIISVMPELQEWKKKYRN